jgi:hypothetical protein
MKMRILNIFKFWIKPVYFFLFLFTSCGDGENIVVFTESEVVRLLSNDSSKSWVRKAITIDGQSPEISECELLIETKYFSSNTNQIYFIESTDEYCGGTSVRLDSGSWEALVESNISDRIDRIAYYSGNGDTKIKKILEITSIHLTTEADSLGLVIQETFESTLSN